MIDHNHLISLLILLSILVLFFYQKYKIPGVISSIYNCITSFSIFNLFLMTGMKLNLSTQFGGIFLFLFSQYNSLNLFKLINKNFATQKYTIKLSASLASKYNNLFIYELLFIFLIPGTLLVFTLPSNLKEISLIITLGSILSLLLWLLFSNMYLPKIFELLENKSNLVFSRTELTNFSQVDLFNGYQNSSKKNTQAVWGSWYQVLIIVGVIGFILWLSHFELSFDSFFKTNNLLQINSNLKTQIEPQIKSLGHPYREISQNYNHSSRKTKHLTKYIYYLFPGNLNLESITSSLSLEKIAQSNNSLPNKLDWSIQKTNAFSIMPNLKSVLKFLFLSLIPLSIYNFFRFGIISSLSLITSSLIFFGNSFLLFLITSLEIKSLFPEIILSSFIFLLSNWVHFLYSNKNFTFPRINTERLTYPEAVKYWMWILTKDFKLSQALNFWNLSVLALIYFLWAKMEIFYSLILFQIAVICIKWFFLSSQFIMFSGFQLFRQKIYYHLGKILQNSKEESIFWYPEEENILGINH